MKANPKKTKPVAVLVADVHYNINTLAIADAAMRQAIAKANELGVPFIVAGDLHDTKAQLRGECINTMILTFQTCQVPSYVIVGNHCRINEKSEAHSLEFLTPYVSCVVDRPKHHPAIGWLLPYYSSQDDLYDALEFIEYGSTIIMHQGVLGAQMGHYIQDKTSLPPKAFASFRVISGHYHRRQDIQCGPERHGNIGTFSYIGNPYTVTFGEAQDGPKGFQVLMDDGSLEFHATNLRKHVILELDVKQCDVYNDKETLAADPGDLIWVKVTGPKSELARVKKNKLLPPEFGVNFKLDLISSDSDNLQPTKEPLQDDEIMDKLIEALPDGEEHKKYLKGLWRELVE